jgi:alpha-galactosidase
MQSTMKTNTKLMTLALSFATALAMTPCAQAEKPVKVFILAGQSNMEGKAVNSLLESQAKDPKTKELFAHLRKNDEWIVRDDVFIKYLNRKGGLTIGYGSPDRTGVELEFGTVMGDHFDEPVVLIKAAWGGHSLYKPFRPPSAGLPPAEILNEELAKAQDKVRKQNEKSTGKQAPLPAMEDIKEGYGSSYRNMMKEVKDTFDNYETMFPALKGKKLELAGFVWFQGFNDMFGDQAPKEYESNMKCFIKDVRKDLNTRDLPFVIGALGQNGSKPPSGGMLAIQTAQLAMNDVPEFKGNVKTIRTDVFADKAAEALIDGWQNHVEEWKKVGSDRGYHYLGSAIWFTRIGHAMGETMIALLDKR